MVWIAKPLGLNVLLSSLVVVLPIIFFSNSSVIILTQIAITIVFALSYNMVLGQAGMLSFGHAVYMGIGGFAVVHVMDGVFGGGVPLPILPLFGGLFSLGVASIVGGFSTRRGGISFAMISLGMVELVASFSIIIIAFFRSGGMLWDRTEAPHFFGIDFARQIEVYYLVAGWMLLSGMAMYLFTVTPIGRLANAVRDNPERIEFIGYSARWVRFYSFCGAGFFAGVAGALSAITFEIASAENLTVQASGIILLIAFLGGIGVFYGPILGAIIFTLLQSVLSQQTDLWELYVGVLFLMTVMYVPSGLAGILLLHTVPIAYGTAGPLIVPYLRFIVPAFLGLCGCIAFAEILNHARKAVVGRGEMVLFWMQINTDDVVPWCVALSLAVVGIWTAKSQVKTLKEAWHTATLVESAPEGAASNPRRGIV